MQHQSLLQFCQLDSSLIDYVVDKSKMKQGKITPGTHIPIVPISHFHDNLPDVAYLFAWNHKNEIFSKEKDFLNKGGSWFSHVAI